MIELVVIGAILLMGNDNKGVDVSVDYFNRFDPLFRKYAGNYLKIPGYDGFKIMKAICMNEAGLGVVAGGIEKSVKIGLENPNDVDGSKSSDGKSWGLMQLTIPTARDFDSTATPQKLNDPEFSIRISAQYIAWTSLRFKTSDPRYLEWVVKSYNQGVGRTNSEMTGGTGYANEYWARWTRIFAQL